MPFLKFTLLFRLEWRIFGPYASFMDLADHACLRLTLSSTSIDLMKWNWTSHLQVVDLSWMQAQAVFHDQSMLILLRWFNCQSLNLDSSILLQAQYLVSWIIQQNAEYIEKVWLVWILNLRINNFIEVHWD